MKHIDREKSIEVREMCESYIKAILHDL